MILVNHFAHGSDFPNLHMLLICLLRFFLLGWLIYLINTMMNDFPLYIKFSTITLENVTKHKMAH